MPTLRITANMTPAEKAACTAKITEISQSITAKGKEALAALDAQYPGLLDRERSKAAQEATDKLRQRFKQSEWAGELESLYVLRHLWQPVLYYQLALRIVHRHLQSQLPEVAASIIYILDGKMNIKEDDD